MTRRFQFSLRQRFSGFLGGVRRLFFAAKTKPDMGTVQFDDKDAALLYSFPKPPSDLQMVIRCYTFINRTSNPTYEELTNCLTKAQKAGIVKEKRGEWVVENDWYRKIHAADYKLANEIESLLAFEEAFIEISIPVVTHRVTAVSKVEYDAIVDALEREWERRMASVRRRGRDP